MLNSGVAVKQNSTLIEDVTGIIEQNEISTLFQVIELSNLPVIIKEFLKTKIPEQAFMRTLMKVPEKFLEDFFGEFMKKILMELL